MMKYERKPLFTSLNLAYYLMLNHPPQSTVGQNALLTIAFLPLHIRATDGIAIIPYQLLLCFVGWKFILML